jgi:hypothetical protein
MEQNLNSDKMPARPSHEAIEDKVGTSNVVGNTEQQGIDRAAMKGAKRAENRILSDEERIPGSTLFTK